MKLRHTYIPGLKITIEDAKTSNILKPKKKGIKIEPIEISKEQFSGIADCAVQNPTYKLLVEALEVDMQSNPEIVKEYEKYRKYLKPVITWHRNQEINTILREVDYDTWNQVIK